MAKKKKRHASNQMGGGFYALLAILLIAIVLICIFAPSGDTHRSSAGLAVDPTITAEDDVYMNEIMASNLSALMLADGSLPDWIELYNASDNPLSLKGYSIMRADDPTDIFVFPDVTIDSGAFLLVYCDNKTSIGKTELHAPFGISASGESLVLINRAGEVVDSVQVPELGRDEVYCRDVAEVWTVSRVATPNAVNKVVAPDSDAVFQTKRLAVSGEIELTEVMSDNVTYAPDENGEYHDYIELHNKGAQPVNLNEWYLSDDRKNLSKWQFPDVTIPADGYLLVYCSGYDRKEDTSRLHTSFRLSKQGTDVVLTRSDGVTVVTEQAPALMADQAYSLVNGKYTTLFAPTPGYANTIASAAQVSDEIFKANLAGVYINEIAASTTAMKKRDWVELYNSTSAAVDLSGYGLSDNASRPRKWQFPSGTVIGPGEYLGVFMTGLDTTSGGYCNTNYKLSTDGGYTLTLCTPDGQIIDRAFVPQQYQDITYGRVQGKPGFYFFKEATPLAVNNSVPYIGKASAPTYSVEGGLYKTGDALTVELAAEPGQSIYYTLDNTDPTQASTLYTAPITVTGTTILRTRVFGNDYLESYMDTQSYLYDVQNGNGVHVVSLVSDPYNLTSEEAGIMVKGPNALPEFPYGSMNVGANFWMDWEREAHVEVFTGDGETMLSSECGVKLHGQYSRAEKQKAFKVIARSKYGNSRFEAPLFSKRDYTEYQSFVLRSSGQDIDKTRMRDSVLTSLAEDTSVMYQETEICVLYLDGVFWGQYNIRERINTASICQFEGWEGDEDALDLIKANSRVMQGSNETYAKMLEWVKSHDSNTDEAYAYVDSVIDIQNYIEYMAIEIFTGNGDTLNVKRYRNPNADGKWRWVLFDLDWAFLVDTDSINRWLTPGGMGAAKRTDNTLFIWLMKNDRFRDEFLTYLGMEMATTFSTQSVMPKIEARVEILQPLIPDLCERWGFKESKFASELKTFISYAKERPMKLLGYIKNCQYLNLTNEELTKYFGEALQVAKDYSAKEGE